MTDLDEEAGPIDGRVARRQRNIDAVLDVVLELFAEEAMFPTIEQAANRSGLSLRSLYRYFADPSELLEATIKRSEQMAHKEARLSSIGQGSLAERIDAFVEMRLRIHDRFGPVFRATIANAMRHPRVADELAKNRRQMREQLALQFDPELSLLNPSDRKAVEAAGEALTNPESIDLLARSRGISRDEIHRALTAGLRALFSAH